MESGLNQSSMSSLSAKVDSIAQSGSGDSALDGNELLESVSSDSLKELVNELTSDGKFDKADGNILKLFVDLLAQLSSEEAPNVPSDGGEEGAAGASPATGGTGGSQAPPAVPEGAAGGGSVDGGKGSGDTEAAGGGEGSTQEVKNDQGEDAVKPGSAAAQEGYDAIKAAANEKDGVSSNEQQAIDAYAEKFGLSSGSSDLSQVLRDTMKSALENGNVDDNEAKAIAGVIDKMGGASSLSQEDLQQMLTEFMKGSEVDSTFSDQDLETFDKILSLVPGAQTTEASASGSTSGGTSSSTLGDKTVAFGDGVSAEGWASYMYQQFMSAFNGTAESQDRGDSTVQMAEDDEKLNGSASA
jgi:hypothetical protein